LEIEQPPFEHQFSNSDSKAKRVGSLKMGRSELTQFKILNIEENEGIIDMVASENPNMLKTAHLEGSFPSAREVKQKSDSSFGPQRKIQGNLHPSSSEITVST
jgi:hypothetical protein